jgi:hypothetical protein
MPRKPKVTATPIENEYPQEGLVIAQEQIEAKTDAEHMTDVLNEVKVEEEPVENAEPIEPVKMKAKRVSKPKATKTEPVPDVEVEVESSLDEVQATVTLPKVSEAKGASPLPEEPKQDVKVTCPDCGKPMSAKTLKYSHTPNCTAKKSTEPKTAVNAVTEDMIEDEVQKRMYTKRAERATRREAMVQNLIKNAF